MDGSKLANSVLGVAESSYLVQNCLPDADMFAPVHVCCAAVDIAEVGGVFTEFCKRVSVLKLMWSTTTLGRRRSFSCGSPFFTYCGGLLTLFLNTFSAIAGN